MPIIGIDLGTSNSAAAVLRGGRPIIIPSSEGITLGGKAFPSYVALTPEGQMLIGEPARRQPATCSSSCTPRPIRASSVTSATFIEWRQLMSSTRCWARASTYRRSTASFQSRFQKAPSRTPCCGSAEKACRGLVEMAGAISM